MQIHHIALVPEMGVDASQLARVSAALQKQATRDLAPIWGISATVDAFPRLEDVPAGYWPLVLTYRELGTDAGIHVDERGQPFALVEMSPSWSLTASHLCLEMLSDPFGNRMLAGLSPCPEQGEVEFLTDICDPCVHPQYAYVVNDVLVSDFCTPAYWEPTSRRERYSFTGAIQAPLEILPGGQLRWYDPRSDSWWTRQVEGDALRDIHLGRADSKSATAREFLDARTAQHLMSTKMTIDAFEARMGLRHEQALQAARSRAHGLRTSFGSLRGMQPVGDELKNAVEALRSRSDRPSRPQVFGALLRASLGVAAADGPPPSTARHGFPGVVTDRPAPLLDDGLFDEDAEDVTMVEEVRARKAAAPPADEPPARARTVPPPLPQTVPPPLRTSVPVEAPLAHEVPVPVATVNEQVCASSGYGEAATLPSSTSLPPPMPVASIPPVNSIPRVTSPPSFLGTSRDRSIAIAAVAAAIVLGIALRGTNAPTAQPTAAPGPAPQPVQTSQQTAPPAQPAQAMQPVQTTQPMRTVGAPAGEMTLPSVETAVHVPAGAAPAAVATINVQPAPPGGQLTAGGGQVEVARRAGTRAKSPVAMTTPAQRAAPPSDRRAPESLDSLIDDRR